MSKKDAKNDAGKDKGKKKKAQDQTKADDGEVKEKVLTKAEMKAMAKPFIDRAEDVAKAGNWDYAIEMYLEGIRRNPTEVENGHAKLREMALHRKMRGGKVAGFFEARKHKPSKDPLVGMINAEWMMSRDPANMMYWRQIIAAARAGEWPEVLGWAVGAMFDINCKSKKPTKEAFIQVRDAFVELEMYTEAVQACNEALQLAPDDGTLLNSIRDLSAQQTIQQGKYGGDGGFKDSVKDIKKQIDDVKADQVTADVGFLTEQLEKARNAYEADPTVAGKIMALVETFERLSDAASDESYLHEAVGVLAKAFKDLSTYSFKMRIGEIKMKLLKAKQLKLLKAGDNDAIVEHDKEKLAFELEEFTERAANYPTDLGLKYEVGARQYLSGMYDDAIASLQQARRDPRNRRKAMNMLGLSFNKKGWHAEAAETFEQALDADLSEARQKDLRYNLGIVYEAMDQDPKALEQYSIVAQIDFNYKDVRKRIEKFRGRNQ